MGNELDFIGRDLGMKPVRARPRRRFCLSLTKVSTALITFVAGAVLGLSVGYTNTRCYLPPINDAFFLETVCPRNCDRNCPVGHSMTAQQLFWKGSMVPMKAEYPYKRVPKVAFMFITRGPLPLMPLWDKFFKGHENYFSVYVHATPGYDLNVSNASAFYGRQVPSQVVKWGSVSLVTAEKRLLANALLDFSNERFVLLSESCIPVFNFPEVYNYLMNSAHSFVESYDGDSPRARGRYSRYMYPTIKRHQWRKGSQWFEMNRKLAIILISEDKYYTVFKRYCKPTCYPDEHYFPTYLNMFHGYLNSNRTVTWVDWSRVAPHPAIFGRENISDGLIESIRNNGTICTYNNKPTSFCYLFARKFAPSALGPLLNMSSRVMKY